MNTPSSPLSTDRSSVTNYAKAKSRMRLGKRFVVTGFFVALIGMLLYCVAHLSVVASLGATVQTVVQWLVVTSLGVVGVGTLLWIVGAVVHFIGGVESDPSGPDLYF